MCAPRAYCVLRAEQGGGGHAALSGVHHDGSCAGGVRPCRLPGRTVLWKARDCLQVVLPSDSSSSPFVLLACCCSSGALAACVLCAHGWLWCVHWGHAWSHALCCAGIVACRFRVLPKPGMRAWTRSCQLLLHGALVFDSSWSAAFHDNRTQRLTHNRPVSHHCRVSSCPSLPARCSRHWSDAGMLFANTLCWLLPCAVCKLPLFFAGAGCTVCDARSLSPGGVFALAALCR